METTIFIIAVPWLLFSMIAAMIGKDREMGFAEALLASLIFSPLAGLLLVFADKRKKDMEHEAKVIELLEKINDANSCQPQL